MTKSDLLALAEDVEKEVDQVMTFGPANEVHVQQLAGRIAAVGASSYIGRVAFAGQASSGIYSVQFNADGGRGYSSTWPEWAFTQAQAALAHGKKSWVISNGSPFGSNLIKILVMSTPS